MLCIHRYIHSYMLIHIHTYTCIYIRWYNFISTISFIMNKLTILLSITLYTLLLLLSSSSSVYSSSLPTAYTQFWVSKTTCTAGTADESVVSVSDGTTCNTLLAGVFYTLKCQSNTVNSGWSVTGYRSQQCSANSFSVFSQSGTGNTCTPISIAGYTAAFEIDCR